MSADPVTLLIRIGNLITAIDRLLASGRIADLDTYECWSRLKADLIRADIALAPRYLDQPPKEATP